MKDAVTNILASNSTSSGGNQFYIDSTSANIKDIKAPSLKLIRGGLSENLTSSRPERLVGELDFQPPKSSARALLQFAGTWMGDDLESCLEEVYLARGEVEF